MTIEKLKSGIFDGPQIWKILKDTEFEHFMNTLQCAARRSFVQVVKNFLGNKKAVNHATLINRMIKNFQNLGCLMSIKMQFSFLHMDKLPENLEAVSDEQKELLHQGMPQMEERYQRRWDAVVLAE